MRTFLYTVEAIGLTLLVGIFVRAGLKTWWAKKNDEERDAFIARLRHIRHVVATGGFSLIVFQDEEIEES